MHVGEFEDHSTGSISTCLDAHGLITDLFHVRRYGDGITSKRRRVITPFPSLSIVLTMNTTRKCEYWDPDMSKWIVPETRCNRSTRRKGFLPRCRESGRNTRECLACCKNRAGGKPTAPLRQKRVKSWRSFAEVLPCDGDC